MFRQRTLFVCIAVLAVLGAMSTAAVAQEASIEELTRKVDALEKRIASMEATLLQQLRAIDAKLAQGAAAAGNEAEAEAAYAKVTQLVATGNLEQAKSEMNTFMQKYGSTQTARKARRVYNELAVIGKEAPTNWGISRWFQGESEANLASDGTTLLVFWETWCPHCQREVPKIQALYDSLKGDGLQIIGLTKVSKSSTDEKVEEFIAEKSVGYPMAKEDGTASAHFGVSGIPAAAVVKGGKVVWRGHPARLNEAILRTWL
jgi:thiol-disulfide isomerase/thioredoxin